ncbi:DMT family transporter [Microbulbifer spongiae]|uniref:DMT family transporter n=1 Tax=Microbulbifer spongiae TaxID=2944933 RepID=A0ABY9EDN4_9GAMM|nr:DMT family transporter [Microbulbifer sp. MI-G]WKD51090.1 DMT family transporter [Microbulbifer sp. MI-G]
MPNSFLYPSIMLVAGVGIPVMATLNGGLGVKLGSSTLATIIMFFVALLISAIYLLKTEGLPTELFQEETPWYFYLGGILVAFYALSITWVSPRYGVGNAVSFVLLGQLLAMCIIDHFGFFGAQQSSLDTKRLIGLVMMTIGVFLVVKRTT